MVSSLEDIRSNRKVMAYTASAMYGADALDGAIEGFLPDGGGAAHARGSTGGPAPLAVPVDMTRVLTHPSPPGITRTGSLARGPRDPQTDAKARYRGGAIN